MTKLRLRSALTRMMAVIGALALFAALALAGLATWLQQIGATTTTALESVRLAHEVQIRLMLHERVHDRLVQTSLEADLRRRLAQARAHVVSAREREMLERVEAHVDDYLSAQASGADEAHTADLQHAAHGALQQFVDVNLIESREARDRAALWDAIAGVVALLLVLANLGAGGWLVWWMRARTIAPLLAFTDTVERFGRGDTGARADESGPTELSEVAASFNRMADTLTNRRSAQSTHLAAVAHDLRNPLWALQLSLQRVRNCDTSDDARARRGLDLAERQVARLGRMIDDLLDASNIEAGHLELRRGMHDLGEVVRELGDQFAGTSAKHRVECRVPPEPVVAVFDPLRIGQVVTNLLTNAIKYSPEGGSVQLELRREQAEAVISVVDDGLGIDPVELSEVFEPFRRLAAGKQSGSGTGLGLFVVRRIVEAHGGQVRVESEQGRGSTFVVRLPLMEAGATERAHVGRTESQAHA